MFDDEEGDGWLQTEPDDWWQQEPGDPGMHIGEVDGAVNHEGESVHAALNSRLRRSTRMTFFDDESGDEEMQIEPGDFEKMLACWIGGAGRSSTRPLVSLGLGGAWCSNEGHSAWVATGTSSSLT